MLYIIMLQPNSKLVQFLNQQPILKLVEFNMVQDRLFIVMYAQGLSTTKIKKV